jgi:hypothetical protein
MRRLFALVVLLGFVLPLGGCKASKTEAPKKVPPAPKGRPSGGESGPKTGKPAPPSKL